MALLVVFAIACVRLAASQQDQWFINVYLDDETSLLCNTTYNNGSFTPTEAGDVVRWKVPDGTIVHRMDTHNDYVVSDEDNVLGKKLIIKSLKNKDFGIYVCFVYRDGTHYGDYLHGINLGGPEYYNVFEQYRYNIKVGGISAAVLMFIVISFLLLRGFRYRKPRRYYTGKEIKPDAEMRPPEPKVTTRAPEDKYLDSYVPYVKDVYDVDIVTKM